MRFYEQYYHVDNPELILQLVDYDSDHRFMSDGAEMIAIPVWLFEKNYRKVLFTREAIEEREEFNNA